MIGINIQAPFAELLLSLEKCVETRTYPLPEKYEGEELALIETPGKTGKFKARIIGTITFSHSFQYQDMQEWISDYNRHRVEQESNFGWNEDKDTYGWETLEEAKNMQVGSMLFLSEGVNAGEGLMN